MSKVALPTSGTLSGPAADAPGTILRNVASTAAVNALTTIVRLLSTFIAIPLLLKQYGEGGLGLWLIALSLIAGSGFINSGFASAVTTYIGRAGTDAHPQTLREAVATAAAVAMAMAAAALPILLPLAAWIDWHQAFTLSDAVTEQDTQALMVVVVLAFAITFPAGVPKHVLVGLMRGYEAHWIELASLVLSIGLLIAVVANDQPIYMAAAAYFFPFPALLLTVGVWRLSRAGLSAFALSHVRMDKARFLATEGAKLAANQASHAVSTQSDVVLIGLILGAAAGAGYGVAQRLFAIPLLFSGLLNDALWPAYCRADASGRSQWLRQTASRAMIGTVGVTALAALLLALLIEPITVLWLRHDLAFAPSLLVGMGVWSVAAVAVHGGATILKAVGRTSLLLKCSFAMMIVNLTCSVVLIKLIGPAGAIWGTVIAYILCMLVPFAVLIPKVIGTSSTHGEQR